ncbi:hypothetical protein BK008_03565 [Methanobacterium sp. MZ-A1]|uniref:restriction endonuclease subunit S n=1 Tax=Methanobacterium sp. MZ-A1 TaxID=1911685 RepID=UPI000C2CE958|nr:restriction endonuclease subunit S [Methanobacterium sp. MZ-A1]AUB57482.1 hypothetical protein BK008_03565 [Methanobacterium sp. MZ-A1]
MKFKPYPEYKDSGFEWIGEIPQEWDIIKIKFISDVIMGQSPKSEDYNFEGVGLPFLQGTAEFGEKSPDPVKYCNNANKFSEIGDILISVRAPVGETNLSNQKFAIGRGLAAIRTVEPLKSYLWYGVDVFKILFNYISSGSTYDAVSIDEVKSMVVSVPTKAEQEKITSFLDKKTSEIDLTIEKDTRLIELLKEKRTAMINHVVTKGLDPTVKMKDSGVEWIGEIPEDWDARKLKLFVSKIGSGITPKGGSSVYVEEGIALLRSQNIHFDGLRLKNVSYITEEINQTMLNSVVKNKDVLLNITGASIGRCTYFENQVDRANVNQHVCIIRPEKIYHKFLNYVLMSDLGQDQIFSTQMGSSREGVNFEQIGNFIVTYPPYEQQKDIADYLDKSTQKIDLTIQKIEENIGLLDEYKKSLIHHVVTGKVNVIKED